MAGPGQGCLDATAVGDCRIIGRARSDKRLGRGLLAEVDAGDRLDREDEGEAVTGSAQLGGAHDFLEDRILLLRQGDREDDLLLRLDLDPEDLLLLVAADAAAEQHGAALRARIDRGLEHRTAPSLAHDAHDQTCVQHLSYSFARSLSRTRTPSSITGMIGAKAINAT